MKNRDLKRRIIEISYKHKLSHLGSCLTAVDIINEIYAFKKPEDKFILSSGHAGLALYVVIEKYEGIDAESIFKHHGVHPDKCDQCHIYCSTGSLGQGLPIAVGMALANINSNIYCLTSDGECAEGSIFEALNIMYDRKISNLKVIMNRNGWAAYRSTPIIGDAAFDYRGEHFLQILTDVDQLPFLRGQDAHYHVMNEGEYGQAMEILKWD